MKNGIVHCRGVWFVAVGLLFFYSHPLQLLKQKCFYQMCSLSSSHHRTDRTQICLCVISHNVITNEFVFFLHVQLTVVLISLYLFIMLHGV